MKRDLVRLLGCPSCRGDLTLSIETEHAGGVEAGTLTCEPCARRYPIVRGVPRFVESDGYVRSFSYEWNRWDDIQLDIANGQTESEDTFVEKTGLTPEDVRGKLVLDTFDWYTPRFQDKNCSPSRVIRWFSEAGLRGLEVLSFPTSIRGQRDDAHSLPVLRSVLPAGGATRFVVFGAGAAGAAAIRRLHSLGLAPRLAALCDNSPAKVGTLLAGHIVQRFDVLRREDYDFVVVASRPGRLEISRQLTEAGLVAGREFGTLEFVTDTALPFVHAIAA